MFVAGVKWWDDAWGRSHRNGNGIEGLPISSLVHAQTCGRLSRAIEV